MSEHPRSMDKESMPAVTEDDLAKGWAASLEEREQRRSGLSRIMARKRVANRIGVSPGTLENLHRDRIKGVRGWVLMKLRAAALADLQREIEAHQHELATIALHPGCALGGAVEEVAKGLARLKAAALELRS